MIHTIVMVVSRFNEYLFLFLMLIDDVQIGRDEAELIKMIIEDVRKVNPTHLNVPYRQVGLDRRASSCLKELNLDGCNLSHLPEEIGNLISLQTLDLAKNNLSTLPDGICNLTCLKRLRLEENNVSNLPIGIGRLTSLERLYLSRNSLCTLPDTIGKLSCLKDLFVGNNKLSHLPSEIGDLDSLETLVLEGNNGFRGLPESKCKLVRLNKFSLTYCNLSHLPSEIDMLISLVSLALEHNKTYRMRMIQLTNWAKLRSLPKLPRSTFVNAVRCPSLERLPIGLDQLGRHANHSGSNKLAENNYLTYFLKQLPKTKGLFKLKDVVDMTVPAGEEELRIWFPYHDGRGLNVSFVVPPSPFVNQKMLGWILRSVLWAPQKTSDQYQYPLVRIADVIHNKIKRNGAFGCYTDATDVYHAWLIYIPQGYRGLQLEGGDEVEISIRMYQIGHDGVPIPIDVSQSKCIKWAIDLIYEPDEIHKANDTWWQMVYNIQL
ncbi:hypothetical protein RHSIM_Rhsim01G0097900 [Rhododendron simsii]|uniref:Disease resistance R13L4/SHOC-2-like LRR domain-containing protein n=1 Tax=Rhododendron simsii TaxID=118357 RepID=A0A834LYW4_RHOSS|nr:hypothetical protein RHSIM_Rhsim01G0097900 [Rhododendron simsii]